MRRKRLGFVMLAVLAVVVLMTGCSQPAAVEPTSTDVVYTGELGTAYEDALAVPEQLALGTLMLETSADAVTEAQAAELLPLWQAFQGSALQGETERLAMAKQIESLMTGAQVAAIAAMQLTQEDEQAWLQDRGGAAGSMGGDPAAAAGPAPGGARAGADMSEEDRAALREQFANMSAEEKADMRAQFGQQGNSPGGVRPSAAASGTVRAVVVLLSERSGQAMAMPQRQRATPTSEQPVDVDPTAMPQPTATPMPGPAGASVDASIDTPKNEPADISKTPTPTATPEETAPASAEATLEATSATTSPVIITDAVIEPVAQATVESVAVAAALVQVPDTNPGPPFSTEISLNRVEPSPLLDGVNIYTVSGLLRNDGDAVYAVNTVNFTFYDADGFRGAFFKFDRRRYGEYINHGAMEADFDCMLLAPGEVCPFIAEIAAYNMGSFYVHADAVVAEWREPVPVMIQETSLVDQGSNVKISGTIINPNTYAIKNVVVNGVLLDVNGQITSMGSAYYVQSIAPGVSVAFNALIPMDAYTTYQVYVQAEGDFK